MTETMRALYAFWCSFGIPAYVEGDVPEDAQMPYITYSVQMPESMGMSTHYARIWMRESGYAAISQKADEIRGRFGAAETVLIRTETGSICLRAGTPFLQRLDMGEPENKCIYINMTISNYQGVK